LKLIAVVALLMIGTVACSDVRVDVGRIGLGVTFNRSTQLGVTADLVGLSTHVEKNRAISLNAGVYCMQAVPSCWDRFEVGPQVNLDLHRLFVAGCYSPRQREARFLVGLKVFP